MVKHIVDARQLTDRQFLNGVFSLSGEMRKLVYNETPEDRYSGKFVGNFFFEKSTRTRTTFDNAAQRLGAKVVHIEDAESFSSFAKGETVDHSLWAIQGGYDLVVLRVKEEGLPLRLARVSDIPIINAGDGRNQHPTQTLLDLFTMYEAAGRVDGLKVAFIGDIARGRTVKSLAYLLAHMDDNELYFVSAPGLGLTKGLRSYLEKRNVKFYETQELDDVLPVVDFAYVTRLQRERVENGEDPRQQEMEYRKFQMTVERANRMKESGRIIHPLPIARMVQNGQGLWVPNEFPEIVPELDTHTKALYFVQSNNGLYVRMALIDILLGGRTGKDGYRNLKDLYERIGDLSRAE
jgi:aspartate carbamoyltransferase catalytic subunit